MSYRVPQGVAHLVDQDGAGDARVYLMQLPDGPPRVLEGSAAVIWLAAVQEGIASPEEVADLFDGDPGEIIVGARSFLAELVSSGLLAPTDVAEE